MPNDDKKYLCSAVHVVDVPVTSVEVLSASEYRRSILFGSGDNTNRVYYSAASPAVVGRGIPSGAGTTPTKLTWAEFGDLVCRPWFAISALGTQSVEIHAGYVKDKNDAKPIY